MRAGGADRGQRQGPRPAEGVSLPSRYLLTHRRTNQTACSDFFLDILRPHRAWGCAPGLGPCYPPFLRLVPLRAPLHQSTEPRLDMLPYLPPRRSLPPNLRLVSVRPSPPAHRHFKVVCGRVLTGQTALRQVPATRGPRARSRSRVALLCHSYKHAIYIHTCALPAGGDLTRSPSPARQGRVRRLRAGGGPAVGRDIRRGGRLHRPR